MSLFLTGSGFESTMGTLTCLNIEDIVSTNQSLYCHHEHLTLYIRKVISLIISEAKESEIRGNILETLEGMLP